MLKFSKNTRGDTLVEVMLALAALSAVLFMSWSTVNKSSQIGLSARQRIVMVNALKEQAEILQAKYANAESQPMIIANTNGSIPSGGLPMLPASASVSATPCDVARNAADNSPAPGSAAFHFNSNTAPTQGVRSGVNGYQNAYIWVQKKVSPTPTDYVDFYIRGCWRTINSGQAEDNSQIVVRFNQ